MIAKAISYQGRTRIQNVQDLKLRESIRELFLLIVCPTKRKLTCFSNMMCYKNRPVHCFPCFIYYFNACLVKFREGTRLPRLSQNPPLLMYLQRHVINIKTCLSSPDLTFEIKIMPVVLTEEGTVRLCEK